VIAGRYAAARMVKELLCRLWKPLALLVLSAALPSGAVAQTATWRFEQIYSNTDGNAQFMVIYLDGQGQTGLEGFALTSVHGTGEHGHDAGYVSNFIFSNDPPSTQSNSRRVLIATQAFADLNIVVPDYVVENQFIPQQTGSLSVFRPYTTLYDSVAYDSLPSNGTDALYRDGTTRQSVAINFAGQSTSVPLMPSAVATAQAVEYYYADWDHYFVTAFASEIALLDGGAFNGNWKRTGETFKVWTQGSSTTPAACRFFSTNFAPKSSHFYTPSASECAAVKENPDWQFEGVAFYMELPYANGTCPAGSVALYRLYNNGMGGAPNHRYTTSLMLFNQMLAGGWLYEGNGITRVFACLPS
jgi:hypothetical protein